MARKKNKDKDIGLNKNAAQSAVSVVKDFAAEVLLFPDGYVLVDFYADWCEYCKEMATVFKKLSSEFQDITFMKMDIDDDQEVAMRFCEEGIPNLVLFKDGNIHAQFLGYDKIKAVKAWLSEAITSETETEGE